MCERVQEAASFLIQRVFYSIYIELPVTLQEMKRCWRGVKDRGTKWDFVLFLINYILSFCWGAYYRGEWQICRDWEISGTGVIAGNCQYGAR